MDKIFAFIYCYQALAPIILFGLYLLAGCSVPISIDVLIAMAGYLAATVIPEYTIPLFLASFLGCYLSASLAYWIGRKFGRKLLKIKWVAKHLPPARLEKVHNFYAKHGFLTLLIGRFIPFGVRNAIFVSAGISKASYPKFLLRDLIACSLWSSIFFFLFYKLGINHELVAKHLKVVNISLLVAFGVTVIAFIWYKARKAKKVKENLNEYNQ